MYLENFANGGGFGRGWCLSCKQPIDDNEPSTRVEFASDPAGREGLTGDYHVPCSRPYASLARALDMLSRFGR
jgi:hypothetical protein